MPERRFRDMSLTGHELDGLLQAMRDRYDFADVGTQCAGIRAAARAKRLLPLWREWGLRELFNRGFARGSEAWGGFHG